MSPRCDVVVHVIRESDVRWIRSWLRRPAMFLADWDAFVRAGRHGRCGATLSTGASARATACLQDWSFLHPGKPLIVAATRPRSGVDSIAGREKLIRVPRSRLPRALETALARGDVGSGSGGPVRTAVEEVDDLVAEVFRRVTRPPPLSSVTALASELGVHRSTLARRWRRAGREDRLPGLKSLLDRGLLAQACRPRAEGRTWSGVADHLGVSPRTLHRIVSRSTGRSPRRIAVSDLVALKRALHREVLDFLRQYDT